MSTKEIECYKGFMKEAYLKASDSDKKKIIEECEALAIDISNLEGATRNLLMLEERLNETFRNFVDEVETEEGYSASFEKDYKKGRFVIEFEEY